jgi:hypothetical protein
MMVFYGCLNYYYGLGLADHSPVFPVMDADEDVQCRQFRLFSEDFLIRTFTAMDTIGHILDVYSDLEMKGHVYFKTAFEPWRGR